MMERMQSNILAEGDPFLSDDDKIDFDRHDFKNIMESTELDKALSEDANWGDFNFDDADIDKMVNPDDLSLEGLSGSDGSFDGLANMPIVEVDEAQVEHLLGHIAKEENISIPLTSNIYPNQNNTMQLEADDTMFEAQPDPLLGRLSRRGSTMVYGASPSTQPPFVMQDMAQEVDALQRMVDAAVMQAIPRAAQETQVPMNNQPGLLDLEQEKLRLLSRLNEINQRQHLNSNTADPFLASGAMSQFSGRGMQQQQLEPPKTAVASIGTMNHAGETPLTSFLRKNQKTQPVAASTARLPSMNHSGNAGGPSSIFSESPMPFDNPLLRGSRTKPSTLFGAMDRTTASQEMVRKLSARSLLARSDSGQNIRDGMSPQEMNGANQTWGETTTQRPTTMSFKTSGILPRHASDNHILRAGTKGSLIRSRSKNTSLSRENLLYMKKSTSRTNSEDSLGSLLPVKRAGGTKYKVGISRSTPRLNMNGPHSGQGGSQMNAMW